MSSISASLCLFSAALCNVAVLDQHFEQQSNHNHPQNQQYNGQGVVDQASNLFGNFANAGLGALGVNQGNRPQNQGHGQGGHGQGQGHGGHNRGPPHQSPCPKKFQYVTNGKEWKGIIRIKNVDINRDTHLDVDFILPSGLQRRVRRDFFVAHFNKNSFTELSRQNRTCQSRGVGVWRYLEWIAATVWSELSISKPCPQTGCDIQKQERNM